MEREEIRRGVERLDADVRDLQAQERLSSQKIQGHRVSIG